MKIFYSEFQRYCRFSAENSDPTTIVHEFRGVPLGLGELRTLGSVVKRSGDEGLNNTIIMLALYFLKFRRYSVRKH